jgi:glycosyltransferase involved in cell wall biosynthesis
MSISVIIPIKNRAHLLPFTLNSIISQTRKPSEIFVVDDHSSDDLRPLKERYKEDVIFISSEGSGPGAARNTGFQASTGNLIQFFDSDDLMTFDKLAIQETQLLQSNSGMAYCPHVKAIEGDNGIWKQADAILYYKPLSSSMRYDQWVIRGACMITQACLFKRELIRDAGPWRTDMMTHEDLEFLFRIGIHNPYPVHSPIPAVLYRQHGQQITDNSTTQQNRASNQLKAFILIQEQMKGKKFSYFDVKTAKLNITHSSAFVNEDQRPENINSLTDILFGLSERVRRKVERTMTQSDWCLLHGVSNNPKHFSFYLNKIKYKKSHDSNNQ